MQENTSSEDRERLISVLEPIIYGDVFDYPLTLEEIHKYCTFPMTTEELKHEIENNEDFNEVVSRNGPFFCLNGHGNLADIRIQRKKTSQNAWRRARKVVKYIKYTPFVKGIMATGSLAAGNMRKGDDLDFLVLITANRIWFVFFILGTLQRIFSRRNLCPNYYISLAHLRLSRKTFYVAREAAQSKAMYGFEPCRRFYDENDWVVKFFPNLESSKERIDRENPVSERRGGLKIASQTVEWFLGGKVGLLIEKILKRLLHHRLRAHYGLYGQSVPEKVLQKALNEEELRFHGLNHEEKIKSEVQANKKRLAEHFVRESIPSVSDDFEDRRLSGAL